jgi:hypothetical protein
MDRMEAMAEAIKQLDTLRVKGLCPDYGRFNSQFNAGYFSDPSLIEMAVANSAADKNSFTSEQESGIL